MTTDDNVVSVEATDREALRGWLRHRVAEHTRTPIEDLDDEVPLSDYGMDSIHAITLVVEIEDRYGVLLDTDTLWDYRNINLLTDLLFSTLVE